MLIFFIIVVCIICKNNSNTYYTEPYTTRSTSSLTDGVRLAEFVDVYEGGKHKDGNYMTKSKDVKDPDNNEDRDGGDGGGDTDDDDTDSDNEDHDGDTESDDEDALPLDGTVPEDIRFAERDGELDDHITAFDPDTMPEFVEIKTGSQNDIPGFKSLFNIHTPKTCCTKPSPKEPTVTCTTKNNTVFPLKSSSKKLHTANYSCNSNGVDPAGVLCNSKSPKPIPIKLSPSSCLPPSVSPSACTNPLEQIYVPEPVDPIKYNVRKYILNPKQSDDVYTEATVLPPRNYKGGAQLIYDSKLGMKIPYTKSAKGTFAVEFD